MTPQGRPPASADRESGRIRIADARPGCLVFCDGGYGWGRGLLDGTERGIGRRGQRRLRSQSEKTGGIVGTWKRAEARGDAGVMGSSDMSVLRDDGPAGDAGHSWVEIWLDLASHCPV